MFSINRNSIIDMKIPKTENDNSQKWIVESKNGDIVTMIQTENNEIIYEKENNVSAKLSDLYEVKTIKNEDNKNDCLSGTKTNLGEFKLTFYCTGTVTKTGTSPTPKRTIAVDPNVIELGSKVEINGEIYIAEDTGGNIKGNRIDVFVGSYEEAINRGIEYEEVSIFN